PRSHGGDGLGPVFNDTSCVACHNQGGTGGGGPASKNVDIISAVPSERAWGPDTRARQLDDAGGKLAKQRAAAEFVAKVVHFVDIFRILAGMPLIPVQKEADTAQLNVTQLAKFHPDFRIARSVVLPRFGTEVEFGKWHPLNSGLEDLLRTQLSVSERRQDSENDVPGQLARHEAWQHGAAALLIWDISETFARIAERTTHAFDAVSRQVESAVIVSELGLADEGVVVRARSTAGLGIELLPLLINNVGDKDPEHVFLSSRRNPTALFGAGLIDSIPDSVIEQAAKTRYRGYPFVNGRVSRLRDGRIGKFGWKGQTASLREFTLTACAVELGLNVPGHEQAVVPYKPGYRSPGLDLSEQECNVLVQFVATLPAPTPAQPANAKHAEYLEAGQRLFAETGCATCHTPKLGDVAGIYSDLLLHKMGPALADAGIYGSALPDNSDDDDADVEPQIRATQNANDNAAASTGGVDATTKSRGPRRSEWRTPPLWGVRDSSPYLHDGRAETIPDAIAMHGGEALASTNKYFKLPHDQRLQLVSFLKSLTAPQLESLQK
ncbi:MAG TPA: di-heme oxidoredictase family protein, partial [Planctomycetaceae bacterium]